MGQRIPESFLKDLRDKADIVELISTYVKLKKQGHNYTACCPFHNEKTPSFSVNALKQFYHCFGCGEHGDVIAFLEKYQGIGFIDAVKQLAEMQNVVIPSFDMPLRENNQDLYSVMQKASQFYEKKLKEPSAKACVDYLKHRGLTGQIAKLYSIGYAPSGWQSLVTYFGQDKTSLELLEKAGLIIKKENSGRYYDRFRDRVMFPIRDVRGRIIGFGGRVLDDTKPKYLNSPETSIFHKGQALYGMFEANQKPKDHVIIVEGYMDVVALAQFQESPVVAALGTAVTEEHLKILFKRYDTLYFCFDGDRAGSDAAWKSLLKILSALPPQKAVRFVFFPDGEDPDSYIRSEGSQAFEVLLKRSYGLADYFFSHMVSICPPDTIDNKAKLVNMAKPLIAQITDSVLQEMMLDRLSSVVGMPRSAIDGKRDYKNDYKKDFKENARLNNALTYEKGGAKYQRASARYDRAGPKFSNLTPVGHLPHPAKILTYLLVHNPSLIDLLPPECPGLDLPDPAVSQLKAALNCIKRCPDHHDAQLYSELKAALPAFYLEKEPIWLQMIPHVGVESEFLGALNKLKSLNTQALTQTLLIKAKNGNLTDQDKLLLKNLLANS